MDNDERDIAELAKTALVQCCLQVSITPNKAIRDKEGWDFVLHFPYETEPGKPLDLRTRVECYVQVKGTTTTNRSRSIKLSNWGKMVKTPYPVFVLIVDFSDTPTPVDAYLVHIDEAWIGAVQQRLRLEQDDSNLHRESMSVTWSDKHRLSTLNGDGLKRMIQGYLPDGMEAHVRNKQKIVNRVGDPIPRRFIMTFITSSPEPPWEELIDLAIGLSDEVNPSELIVEEDVRFDIPLDAIHFEEGAWVVVENRPGIPLELLFRAEVNGQAAKLPGTLYTPEALFTEELLAQVPASRIKELIDFRDCYA